MPITGNTPAPEPLGSPTAPAGDPEEWRPVTVLFADIVEFAAMSERLDAETVREITTECFCRLVPEVTRYGGTIDKFMGDAVMALLGAPTTHEDDPARALWAALAMQWALERFNVELERAGKPRLTLRIGIESGGDVAGVREYAVIGDAVNVAARLPAATEPTTILVGAISTTR